MDVSNFKIHHWLMIGGGTAMLILGMALDWTSVDFAGVSDGGDGPFNYFFTGGIAWLLVVGVGVLVLLDRLGRLPDTQPWPLIFLLATGLATILMVLRIILGARFDVADRGAGMWGALIWSVIALVGAYMNYTASGGTIEDLKSLDKIKGRFSSGDTDDVPPPPPSASAP